MTDTTPIKLSSIPKAIYERLYWRDGVGAATYDGITVPIADKPDLTLHDEWEIIFYSLDGGSIAHSMTPQGDIIWIPLIDSDKATISAYLKEVTKPVPIAPVVEPVLAPAPPITPVIPV